jgi:hypothetical protein
MKGTLISTAHLCFALFPSLSWLDKTASINNNETKWEREQPIMANF